MILISYPDRIFGMEQEKIIKNSAVVSKVKCYDSELKSYFLQTVKVAILNYSGVFSFENSNFKYCSNSSDCPPVFLTIIYDYKPARFYNKNKFFKSIIEFVRTFS